MDEEELGGAEREGVNLEFLVSPIELTGEDGRLTGVRFIRNRLGEPDASGRRSPIPIPGSEFVVPADTVIPAVSQAADLASSRSRRTSRSTGTAQGRPRDVRHQHPGRVRVRRFVTGPTTLIEAAGHGKKAAYAVDRYLAGRTDVTVSPNVKITSSWRHDMPELYDVLPRQHIPMVECPRGCRRPIRR